MCRGRSLEQQKRWNKLWKGNSQYLIADPRRALEQAGIAETVTESNAKRALPPGPRNDARSEPLSIQNPRGIAKGEPGSQKSFR